jgi:hypothetical protein
MTLQVMILKVMTLKVMTLKVMTLKAMILKAITLKVMILKVTILKVMTLKVMTLKVILKAITLKVMILKVMTLKPLSEVPVTILSRQNVTSQKNRCFAATCNHNAMTQVFFFFFSFRVLQLILPEAPQPYVLLYYPRIGRSKLSPPVPPCHAP